MKIAGKVPTLLAVVLGIGALVVAAMAVKKPLLELWYTQKLARVSQKEKWSVAEKLERLGSPAAEDWYLEQLDSEERESRKAAAEKLGEMKSIQAIPRLAEILWNSDNWPPFSGSMEYLKGWPHGPVAVSYSSDALAAIGAPAVPSLAGALVSDKHWVVKAASRALEKIGKEPGPAVSVLAGLLRHEDVVVRRFAASALSRKGSGARAALMALVEALADEDEHVRKVAARALGTPGFQVLKGRSSRPGAKRLRYLQKSDYQFIYPWPGESLLPDQFREPPRYPPLRHRPPLRNPERPPNER